MTSQAHNLAWLRLPSGPAQDWMGSKISPVKPSLAASPEGTSKLPSPPSGTQLSGPGRVPTTVSSAAMDRGLLAMADATPRVEAEPAAARSADALSDAEVMLQVKAGDSSAFNYLVQKYRRPMLSFMYRMAHNTAVAEDLAQEVFLRVYRSREN